MKCGIVGDFKEQVPMKATLECLENRFGVKRC